MSSVRCHPVDTTDPFPCPSEEMAILRAIAQGHRGVCFEEPSPEHAPGVRRATLVLQTLAEILATGTFQPRIPTFGGIEATEWSTKERGSVRFLSNPTSEPLTGGAFPAPSQCFLEPGQVLPWLHDFPIGPAGNYLSAYAGLVKSDAAVLHAGIRPDPHPGAMVVVHAAPGTSAEVVLFHTGGGRSLTIHFTDYPAVEHVDSCVVIALPTALAGETTIAADGVLSCGPWTISHDGSIHRWRSTTIDTRLPGSFRIDPIPVMLRVDGKPVNPEDFDLDRGSHRLELMLPNEVTQPPLLIQDGACHVVELHEWQENTGLLGR